MGAMGTYSSSLVVALLLCTAPACGADSPDIAGTYAVTAHEDSSRTGTCDQLEAGRDYEVFVVSGGQGGYRIYPGGIVPTSNLPLGPTLGEPVPHGWRGEHISTQSADPCVATRLRGVATMANENELTFDLRNEQKVFAVDEVSVDQCTTDEVAERWSGAECLARTRLMGVRSGD